MSKPRCSWVPPGNTLYEKYHDEEWGVPVHDDRTLFEYLTLEGAQAGLSWLTVLKRRDGYRKAFANFDWEKVAAYDQKMVEKLMQDSSIIRHRGKIESTISNARLFSQIRKEFGSFDKYIWGFVGHKTLRASEKATAASQAVSRDLMKRGFKFVGPSIIYALMQAVGLINDHAPHCLTASAKIL